MHPCESKTGLRSLPKSQGRKVGEWRMETNKLRPRSCTDPHMSNVFFENWLLDLKFTNMFRFVLMETSTPSRPHSFFAMDFVMFRSYTHLHLWSSTTRQCANFQSRCLAQTVYEKQSKHHPLINSDKRRQVKKSHTKTVKILGVAVTGRGMALELNKHGSKRMKYKIPKRSILILTWWILTK